MNDGTLVGIIDGSTLGSVTGVSLGVINGVTGRREGFVEGLLEGFLEGKNEGTIVGNSEIEFSLGIVEGEDINDIDGNMLGDGTTEGFNVGGKDGDGI